MSHSAERLALASLPGKIFENTEKNKMENDDKNTQAGSDCQERLVSLAECIKAWWEDHKYDVCGEYGDYNVYDNEPKFVTFAKDVIGDWECQANETSAATGSERNENE